jgi:hypothetical protein
MLILCFPFQSLAAENIIIQLCHIIMKGQGKHRLSKAGEQLRIDVSLLIHLNKISLV